MKKIPCEMINDDNYNNRFEIQNKKSSLRYRCDNPNCRLFFIEDNGQCPFCGSKKYHSFEWSLKIMKETMKKVIDDLIKNE